MEREHGAGLHSTGSHDLGAQIVLSACIALRALLLFPSASV